MMLKSRPEGTTGKISADISWQASTDIDGTVAGYRIYRENERGFGRLADTKATSHTVSGLDPKVNHRFLVRAVDDRGDESEDSSIVTTRKSGIEVSAGAAFFAPIGRLADLADPGFGLAVRAGMNDFCDIAHLNAFIETGAFRCGGANDRVDYFVMAPVAIGASYSLPVFSFMSVEPALSFGYAWNAVSYRETILADAEMKTGFDPVVTGGLDLNFSMGQRFFMRLRGRFGAIMEQDGAMYFSTVNLGAGCLFGL